MLHWRERFIFQKYVIKSREISQDPNDRVAFTSSSKREREREVVHTNELRRFQAELARLFLILQSRNARTSGFLPHLHRYVHL